MRGTNPREGGGPGGCPSAPSCGQTFASWSPPSDLARAAYHARGKPGHLSEILDSHDGLVLFKDQRGEETRHAGYLLLSPGLLLIDVYRTVPISALPAPQEICKRFLGSSCELIRKSRTASMGRWKTRRSKRPAFESCRSLEVANSRDSFEHAS